MKHKVIILIILAYCLLIQSNSHPQIVEARNTSRRQPTPTPTKKPTSTPSPKITPTPTITPAPPSSSGFVKRIGDKLYLNNIQYKFVGVNRYNTAGDDKVYSCGYDGQNPDLYLTKMFADLKNSCGANALRFWAYQSYAPYNSTTNTSNFSLIDRAITYAKQNNIKLVMTLEDQWGNCTPGSYKYNDWYKSCFKDKTSGTCPSYYQGNSVTNKLTYKDYVSQIVSRYKNEPTILMWQLMNEAETKSPSGQSDPAALYNFGNEMSQYIKSIDPNHLVSFGTIGNDVAGLMDGNYKWIHSIPAIDIVESHDYGEAQVAFPAMISDDMAIATELGKPYFIGEAGIDSPTYSFDTRATLFNNKMSSIFLNGGDGYLIWHYANTNTSDLASFGKDNFTAMDPLCKTLKTYPKFNCDELGTCPVTSYQDTIKYDFEGTTQNWQSNGSVNTKSVTSSTSFAKSGIYSLSAGITLVSSSWSEAAVSNPLSSIENWSSLGSDLIAYVYIPNGTGNISGSLYIKDGSWGWFESQTVGLAPGMWNQIWWKNAKLDSIRTVGIRVYSSNYPYSGQIYLDKVVIRKKI